MVTDQTRNGEAEDTGSAVERLSETGSAPSRYQIVEKEGARYLQCINAANLHLRVERGLSVDSASRRNYPRQCMFLDGVYTGAPFLDNKARQYSLDHHAECVRAFTAATCEQAAALLLQGLPLAEGTWEICMNEPDLDALLAAWVLLNHREMLKDDCELLRAAMPLIRVEGIIDAHGLDKDILTGLAEDVYAVHKRTLDELMEPERRLKAAGMWEKSDYLLFTQDMLDQFDRLFLTDSYLFQLLEVEEIACLPIAGSQVAILCRSTRGVYDAELALKDRYAKQLGVIVLDRGNGHYTLRQVDTFLHRNLSSAYRRLNKLDPKANAKTNCLWGGSAHIGGSPRETGSGLSAERIMSALQDVYQHMNFVRRLWHWLTH